jgi:hypothetical protein
MNIEFFAGYLTALSCRRWLTALAVVAMTITAGTVQAETPAPNQFDSSQIGEVSLVLGKAWLESAGGRKKPIIPGTLIRATDRIHTESNGHVHIRFIDQALVSVRPDSRLQIVRYDYSAEQPEQSTIKLSLEEGVTRSISGKGARAARERFRMNTPIAAIGVRGTDFLVSASQGGVRALVNEGAIVLAPFSSDCTVDAFGPCAVNAIELTDTSLQIIELDGSSASPRLLPSSHERDPGMMRDEVELALAGNKATVSAEDDNGASIYQESITLKRVSTEVASASPPAVTLPEPSVPVVFTPAPSPTPQVPVVADFTPPAPVIPTALTERQLVWGRWADGQADQERITLTYLEAKEGRDITVGNTDYMLFRTENGSTRIQALGTIGFSLNSAQAFYHSESGVVSMAVSGGSLNIDFDNNSFATSLDMSHSLTGNVNFSAAGRLYSGGYFHTRSATERMAGAVSLDGAEAGYFFEKQLDSGNIQGLTLWGKQ